MTTPTDRLLAALTQNAVALQSLERAQDASADETRAAVDQLRAEVERLSAAHDATEKNKTARHDTWIKLAGLLRYSVVAIGVGFVVGVQVGLGLRGIDVVIQTLLK